MSFDIDFGRSTVLNGPVECGYDIKENYLKPKQDKTGYSSGYGLRENVQEKVPI